MQDEKNETLEGFEQARQSFEETQALKSELYKRTINRVLKGPIDGELEPLEWQRLKECESLVLVRLEEMGIRLVVNDSDRVCYLTNLQSATDDDAEFVAFRSSQLSRTSSIIFLLCLQKYLESEEGLDSNLRRFTLDEMVEALFAFEDSGASDVDRKFQQKIRQSLKDLEQFKLIRGSEIIKGKQEEVVYEVRPLIKFFQSELGLRELRNTIGNYLRSNHTPTHSSEDDQKDDSQAQLNIYLDQEQ